MDIYVLTMQGERGGIIHMGAYDSLKKANEKLYNQPSLATDLHSFNITKMEVK
jgi:hypothetical protein